MRAKREAHADSASMTAVLRPSIASHAELDSKYDYQSGPSTKNGDHFQSIFKILNA